MIERFDSDADAPGNRLDVVRQCGFGVRMTQVRLHILDGFLLDPEKEVVDIDVGPPRVYKTTLDLSFRLSEQTARGRRSDVCVIQGLFCEVRIIPSHSARPS
jgi:hypothetical protein